MSIVETLTNTVRRAFYGSRPEDALCETGDYSDGAKIGQGHTSDLATQLAEAQYDTFS